jgi:hypothetical protein
LSGSNASPIAFGWEFQSNAAIVLMLKNIKNALSVKVEGSTEDIEIALDNGNMIFSQAKSVFRPDDYSNVKAKMQTGLGTLNEAAKAANVEKLIYITNSPNPFYDVQTMHFFYGLSSYAFDDLPDSCKSAISDIIDTQSYDSINVGQLNIYVLPFHGDGENRYKVIKEAVYEFLHMVGIDDSGLGQEMLETWQRFFSINASQHDLSASITKKQLVWPLIVSKCEVCKDDGTLAAYDDGEIDEITNRYHSVICNNSERFEFITKVMSDYNSYAAPVGENRIKSFVESCWKNFKCDFEIVSVPPTILEAVIKLAMSKVLQTRFTVSRIKGEINL